MEKTVIFRDRQEFQAADPNNMQGFTRASIDHLIVDAVSNQRRYTGFEVTQSSTTQVTVAPGRYYNGGAVFVNELAQAMNLLQYLPGTTKKIVAIVAWGQSLDEDVQPRDFIIDLTSGATEPQAVAMRSTRYCQINPLPGVEAADPQPPVIQTGTVAVAYVYLGTGGIERIEMQGDAVLPNAEDHEARLDELEDWRAIIDPRVNGLASDLAALARKTESKAARVQVVEIAMDMALLKEKLDVPTTYNSYDADNFNSEDKSNTNHAGYAARIKHGLLFPLAASDTLDLALFNPIEPQVSVSTTGLALPVYTHTPVMATAGKIGDLGISSYQVQTLVENKVVPTKTYCHYGTNANFRPSWWNASLYTYQSSYGEIDQEGNLYTWVPRYGELDQANNPGAYGIIGHDLVITKLDFGVWDYCHQDHYEWDRVSTNVTGCSLGKSFLLPNSRWITKVGLNLTAIGASGDIQVMICGTRAGKPDLGKVLTEATVTQANLKTYPEETSVTLPPAFLEGGFRYAIVLMTQGDHRTAVCSSENNSQNPSQGLLYYGQDGDWYLADATKDLLFTLYGAKFTRTRTVVQLESLQLSGGITDIEMEYKAIRPDGTNLQFEIQPSGSGAWYRLGDLTLNPLLAAAPNLVNFRAVLQGTIEVQPALVPATGAILVSRPAEAFQHWSVARNVTPNVQNIVVKLEVSHFDDDYHSLTPKIKSGGSELSATASTIIDIPGAKLFTYTWSNITSTGSYEVKLAGTRDTGSVPFSISNRIDVAVS